MDERIRERLAKLGQTYRRKLNARYAVIHATGDVMEAAQKRLDDANVELEVAIIVLLQEAGESTTVAPASVQS